MGEGYLRRRQLGEPGQVDVQTGCRLFPWHVPNGKQTKLNMAFTREHSGDRLQECMTRFNYCSHGLRAQGQEITALKEALRVSRGTVERYKNILGLE